MLSQISLLKLLLFLLKFQLTVWPKISSLWCGKLGFIFLGIINLILNPLQFPIPINAADADHILLDPNPTVDIIFLHLMDVSGPRRSCLAEHRFPITARCACASSIIGASIRIRIIRSAWIRSACNVEFQYNLYTTQSKVWKFLLLGRVLTIYRADTVDRIRIQISCY